MILVDNSIGKEVAFLQFTSFLALFQIDRSLQTFQVCHLVFS